MSGRNLGIAVACLLLLGMPMTAQAQENQSQGNGAWHDDATWSLGIPSSDHDVVIRAEDSVGMANTNAVAKTLTINGVLSNHFTTATNTFTVGEGVTVNGRLRAAGAGGTTTNGLQVTSGGMTVANTGEVIRTTAFSFNINGGNFINNGSYTQTSTGLLTITTGSFTHSGTLWNSTGTGAITVNHATLGTFTFTKDMTHSGGITIGTGGLTIPAGLALTRGGSGAITLTTGNFVNYGSYTQTSSGGLTITAGSFTHSGTLWNSTGTGAITVNNATLGTFTLTEDMTHNGGITIGTGGLTIPAGLALTRAGTGVITLTTGNFVNYGSYTQTSSGGLTITAGSFTHSGTLWNSTGTGAITVNNATLGTFTFTEDMTHNGGITIGTGGLTIPAGLTLDRQGAGLITLTTGNFVNYGSYTQTSTGGLTITAGDFTNAAAATFDNSGNAALNFNGDFTNEQSDPLKANWGTGVITFLGLNTTIDGIANFYRLTLNKTALANTLTLGTDVTISGNLAGALTLTRGTLVTDGYDLTVNGGPLASVTGTANSKLDITTGGTVTLRGLDQSLATSLKQVSVSGTPTVNILGTHTLHVASNRCDISGGTVNYQFDGTQLSLPDPGTDVPVGGWFATGGTVNFSRDISAVSRAVFAANGTSVIKFVGGTASDVTLHNSATDYPATWTFSDLRVEKTDDAKVAFKTADIGLLRSAVCAGKLTVNPAAEVDLGGMFSVVANGYLIGGDIVNDGSLVLMSGPNHGNNNLYVAGSWSGTGAFAHGGKLVTFDGSGDKTVALGTGSFYDLTVNKPAGSLSHAGDLTVERNLLVSSGTFAVGENQLTLGTGSGTGSVTVGSGGTFSAVGSAGDATALVTASAAGQPYVFMVNSGATIAARYATFRWMSTGGILINSGAVIDPVLNFSDCTFDHGDLGGQMLRIMNTQTLDLLGVSFYGAAGNNIAKLAPATSGRITVFRGSGTRWGELYEMDPFDLIHWSVLKDVGVTAILRPAGTVSENTAVYPKMTVVNRGDVAETFLARCIITDGEGEEKFNKAEQVTGLGIGETRDFQFTTYSWPATPQGSFYVRCTTELAGDMDNSNDKQEGYFTVSHPGGWSEAKPMPIVPTDKPVKDGAWLAVGPDAVTGEDVIYAAKGNKTTDFFKYAPTEGDSGAWHDLKAIPHLEGAKTKPPSKGCVGVSDGENYVYMAKGNNTLGFWRYDIARDTWVSLPGVPEGPNRKRVKGGTDMVYAVYKDTGCIILLKGYKTEFYRFNTEAERWDTLPNAPAGGGKAKYDKGSFLAYDQAGHIYAHQAKYYDKTAGYHYMFRYDLETGRWTDTLKGMPLAGWHGGKPGKNKKSKDGAAGDWYAGSIYALKGGNTQQFFKYIPLGDSWYELDTIPAYGSTGKKKYVKYGADLVSYGGTFFALKGNKTLDLWRYVANGELRTPNSELSRAGVMAGNVEVRTSKFELLPNPIASGFATLRFGLPKAGPVAVTVFDIAGRAVLRQSAICHLQSAITLDLRKVPAGVYLVRLDAGNHTATQKLVVQR